MQQKTFRFWQNNSGGFHLDIEPVSDSVTLVGHNVHIEAENATQANKIAELNGVYFDGVSSGLDCDCCGDRWSRVYYPDPWAN